MTAHQEAQEVNNGTAVDLDDAEGGKDKVELPTSPTTSKVRQAMFIW
jgi:hypothetical protein